MSKGIKAIMTVLAVFCVTAVGFGQWSIGPRVAVGSITTEAQDVTIIAQSDNIPPDLRFEGGNSVQSLGFMLYNNIGIGFLQFEVLGTKYEMDFTSSKYVNGEMAGTSHTETNFILELPVAAGFRVKNTKIGVGPVLEIAVDKKNNFSLIDRYHDTSKKFNGGFQGLVGYNKGIFHFDLKYVYRFESIVDGIAIGMDRLKLNKSANRLTFSVGVAF